MKKNQNTKPKEQAQPNTEMHHKYPLLKTKYPTNSVISKHSISKQKTHIIDIDYSITFAINPTINNQIYIISKKQDKTQTIQQKPKSKRTNTTLFSHTQTNQIKSNQFHLLKYIIAIIN